MDINKKLAKPNKTIEQHSKELIEQANLLYKLGYIKSREMYIDLLISCKIHDNGKANSKFQNRVKYGGGFNPNNEVPHSVLSVFYIDKEKCINPIAVYFSVLFHHYRGDSPITIFNEECSLITDSLSELGFSAGEAYNSMKRVIKKVKGVFEEPLNEKNKQYAVLLKGFLHKCDYSASAGITCEFKNDFLNECMDSWKKQTGNEYYSLQKFCRQNSGKNIIVTAPTGMGKTEAGLLWCGNNKCFFVLPLKTAINAMYERIKELCGEDYKHRVALVHSDMKAYYLRNLDEKQGNEADKAFDFGYAQSSRQFSLPITVCTPDQIFDFALKYPGYEYKLAMSSYSRFIIDEIQMYDPELLAAIIYAVEMIHTLGGKVAVLTATLPPFVKEELVRAFTGDAELENFSGDGKLRHNVGVFEDKLTAEDVQSIIKDTRCGSVKKYLVVCNAINVANDIYEQLKASGIDADINLFHSNFTRKDRAAKEGQILKAAKIPNDKLERPQIWVSTSVVEASLDIDFDILITELSDLFSLFQRFGRVNRKGKKDYSKTNCYVFTEIQGNAKYFVDETIHSMSKSAIKNFEGVISEYDKNNLIEEYLSVERIKDSDYYNKYLSAYKEYQVAYEYIKSQSDGMRRIDRIDAIPIEVYDQYKNEIDGSIQVCTDGNASPEERLKASEGVFDYTVSVRRSRIDTKCKSIHMGHSSIPIINCSYSSEYGVRFDNTVQNGIIKGADKCSNFL